MWDILHKYGHDYKVILVGAASMSAYEITHPGGSVEHFNEESGAVWLGRIPKVYPAAVWLNPLPEAHSGYTPSVNLCHKPMHNPLVPLRLPRIHAATRPPP